MVKVFISSHQQGWGSQLKEVMEFDSHEAAEQFCIDFNSVGHKTACQEWHLTAELDRYSSTV